MLHDTHSALPSQFALVTLAHVAKYPYTPNLHHRAVLVTHLLRAYSRSESARGTDIIDSEGPLGLKQLSGSLQAFQRTNAGDTEGQWKEHTKEYLEQSRTILSAAVRHAYSCGAIESGEVGAIGLSFIFQMEAADRRKEHQLKKVEPHTNPFLTLAIAREILFEIDRTAKEKYGRKLTDDIQYEPISNIKRFYEQTKKDYPFDLDLLATPNEKIEECVKVLCDLACKLDSFQRSMYGYGSSTPPFRAEEGVSLRMLRDYLEPYKQGREKTVAAQQLEGAGKASAEVIDFAGLAEKRRRKNGGIIRNTPEPV